MKLSEVGELSLLGILRNRFGKTGAPGVLIGIGDDCAVVRPAGRNLLLTTDMMVEGVHFDMRWTTPFQVGFKLVSVNVSDVYAMGGRPEFLLLNFSAGRDSEAAVFHRIFDGIEKASEQYGVSIVGGDISSSERIVLSATVTGYASKIIRRSGARVGDSIYVTGCLGDAACGLQLLKRMKKPVELERRKKGYFDLQWDIVSPLIRRHLMPSAVEPGRGARSATAMIDISDGLFIDLSRICRESGVGARVYEERVPVSGQLKKAAEHLGVDPLTFATGGGEDYELLFTAPTNRKVEAICIGEVTKSGMTIVDAKGKKRKIPVKGYEHFAA
jgi:thiamine-monophosphate kinase